MLRIGTKKFLHYGIEEKYREIVKILIKYGTDVNVKNRNDETPLLLSCKYKKRGSSITLIQSGTKIHGGCKSCKEIYDDHVKDQLYRYFDSTDHLKLEFKKIK